MKYDEVARKLHVLGCVEIPRRGDGAHHKWHNPATGGFVPVRDGRSQNLRTSTLRSIVRMLGLDWEAFDGA
jgi:hypothetical protein